MNTLPPVARIREDADVIDVIGQGCTVPLTLDEARTVRDQLTAHITMIEAERYGGLPPVGQAGLAQLYREHEERQRERTRWLDTGSGPGAEVTT